MLIYSSPNSNQVEILQNVSECLLKFEHLIFQNVLVFGDFNARIGTGDDRLKTSRLSEERNHLADIIIPARNSMDSVVNFRGKQLLEFCMSTGLVIFNGRHKDDPRGSYTYHGSNGQSTIDLLIAHPCNLFKLSNFDISGPLPYSDHSLIQFTAPFVFYPNAAKLLLSSSAAANVPTRFKWKDFYRENYVTNLENELFALGGKDIASITDAILRAASDHAVPTKPPKKKIGKNPWYNPCCNSLKNEFNRLKRSKVGTQLLSKARNRYRNHCRLEKAKFSQKQAVYIHKQASENPKKFWSLFNRSQNDSPSAANMKIDDLKIHFATLGDKFPSLAVSDTPMPSNAQKHKLMCHEHDYISLDSSQTNLLDHSYNVDVEDISERLSSDILNRDVEREEVIAAINSLKNNKSPGIDNLLTEFFKVSKESLAQLLTDCFNKILASGQYPKDWSTAIIVPLHKKGDQNNADNYRGISLCSNFAKIFSMILNKRLQIWLDEGNKLTDFQAGYRKGYSPVDNIFLLKGLTDFFKVKAGKLNKKLFVAFIDFSKAFDLVNRAMLWEDLLALGIHGRVFDIIQDMYKTTLSRVRWNGDLSDPFEISRGVLQGEVLSPLLFSLYINDMQSYFDNHNAPVVNADHLNERLVLNSAFFADDTFLISTSAQGLQYLLDKLSSYCKMRHLYINESKSEIVIFNNGNSKEMFEFKINDTVLKIVDSYHYLGMEISNKGNFTSTFKDRAIRGQRSVFAMMTKIHALGETTLKFKIELFTKIVSPTLLYGAEIWGSEKSNEIEQVFKNFIKYVFQLRKSTPDYFIYGESDCLPIYYYSSLQFIGYWFRLLDKPNRHPAKRMYYLLKSLSNEKKKGNKSTDNWYDQLKRFLDKLDLSHLLLQDEGELLSNRNQILHLVKSKLRDHFVQKLHQSITESAGSKAALYSRIAQLRMSSTDFTYYMSSQISENQKKLICKFVTSNHTLPVEVGRWKSVPHNDRICSKCDLNEIGNELHCILKCSRFQSDREKLLPAYFRINPNMTKLAALFQSSKKPLLVNLCKLLRIIDSEFRNSCDTVGVA